MAWDLSNVTFQNDNLQAEFRDACAEVYGWRGASDTRGATKAAFARYCVKHYFVKSIVEGYRSKLDAAAKPTRVQSPNVD